MRVLVAFDKFKEALTALEACEAAGAALRQALPQAEIDLCPLTDGGDGFAAVLTRAAGGETREVIVTSPLQRPISARFGLIAGNRISRAARSRLSWEGAGRIGVIEMACASGLALVPPELRDPWKTTSLGTGELIREAAQAGAEGVLLGIGGSATNDLGLGALSALGWRFFSSDGAVVAPPLPEQFDRITRLAPPRELRLPPLRIACDVSNPLLGRNGATSVYGPQKGLRADDYERLEGAIARMASLLCASAQRPASVMAAPGAGAAGGLGFGLMAALDAKLLSGSALIADWLELDRRVAEADLILTGEGRFDASSLLGKGPGAVIERAVSQGKPVHVFAGQIEEATASMRNVRLHAITPDHLPRAEALSRSAELLFAAVQASLTLET